MPFAISAIKKDILKPYALPPNKKMKEKREEISMNYREKNKRILIMDYTV